MSWWYEDGVEGSSVGVGWAREPVTAGNDTYHICFLECWELKQFREATGSTHSCLCLSYQNTAAVLPPLARHLLQPTSCSFLCDVREMVALPARARASILLPDFYNLMPLGYKKMNVLSRKILPNMLIRLPNHIRPWRHLVMFPLIQPEILCSIRFQDTFTSVWTSWKMRLCPHSLHHPHHALLSAGPSGSHIFQSCHLVPWVGFLSL